VLVDVRRKWSPSINWIRKLVYGRGYWCWRHIELIDPQDTTSRNGGPLHCLITGLTSCRDLSSSGAVSRAAPQDIATNMWTARDMSRDLWEISRDLTSCRELSLRSRDSLRMLARARNSSLDLIRIQVVVCLTRPLVTTGYEPLAESSTLVILRSHVRYDHRQLSLHRRQIVRKNEGLKPPQCPTTGGPVDASHGQLCPCSSAESRAKIGPSWRKRDNSTGSMRYIWHRSPYLDFAVSLLFFFFRSSRPPTSRFTNRMER